MNRALRQSILYEDDEIDYESLLRAAAEGVESSEALSQCLNLTPEKVHSLRNGLKEERVSGSCPGIYNLDTIDESAEKVIRIAMKMASASGCPDPEHPGLISAFHLIGALSMCEDIKKDLGTNRGIAFKQAVNKIADWYFDVKHFSSLGNNQNAIRQIGFCQSQHRTMIGNIFGQNEALNMVNEAFSLDYFTYHSGHQGSKMPTVFLFSGLTV